MRYLSLLILFGLVTTQSEAQIQNGSFEEYTSLPNAFGQISKLEHWNNAYSVSASPDYYHVNGYSDVELPNSLGATLNPHHGNGALGMIACGAEGSNKREYISTQFTAPLNVGRQYMLSFRISNGLITSNSFMGTGIDNFGVALTTGALVQNNDDPIITPTQFEIDTVFYDRNWSLVSFTFTASEAFNFLTVGVFKDDSDVTFTTFESPGLIAYYFLDSFFMMELPDDFDPSLVYNPKGEEGSPNDNPTVDPDPNLNDSELFFMPNAFTPNLDGDNDLFKPAVDSNVHMNEYQFQIYNRWGEMLFTTFDIGDGWNGTKNGLLMDAGVYVWKLTYKEFKGEETFTRNFNGNVSLIR